MRRKDQLTRVQRPTRTQEANSYKNPVKLYMDFLTKIGSV